jgi:ectoine hydroxylase-related dioxygenase (phytanoyl-CoA dioxygenase family)
MRMTNAVQRQRETFWEDGVVHLPHALEPTWIDLVALGIERNLRNPGPFAKHPYKGTEREFYSDECNYHAVPEYRMLLDDSPIAELVAAILGTEQLWLFYDQIFVKDAGRSKRTPWHQDITYWLTGGTKLAAFWISTASVPPEEALEFVRGSHRGPTYAGTAFDASDDTAPYYAESQWPRLPDIEADRNSYEIVSLEVERGDVVMFHPAVLHGGGVSEAGRRTLSLRFFGDDVVYETRPGRPSPPYPGLNATLKPGQPLRSSWFPRVWPR